MFGNKIADKIIPGSESKEDDKTMSAGEIYIPPEKRQINDDLKSF